MIMPVVVHATCVSWPLIDWLHAGLRGSRRSSPHAVNMNVSNSNEQNMIPLLSVHVDMNMIGRKDKRKGQGE